jgi:hypothetical protein
MRGVYRPPPPWEGLGSWLNDTVNIYNTGGEEISVWEDMDKC